MVNMRCAAYLCRKKVCMKTESVQWPTKKTAIAMPHFVGRRGAGRPSRFGKLAIHAKSLTRVAILLPSSREGEDLRIRSSEPRVWSDERVRVLQKHHCRKK